MRTQRGAWIARRGRRGTLLTVLAGLLVGIGGVSWASGATSNGSSGSFILTGDVSGTLKVPGHLPGGATGCTITINVGAVKSWSEDFNFYGSKLTVDGQSKRVKFVDLQVGVRSLGRRFTLGAGTNSPNNIYVMIGSEHYSWNSVAGTVSTAKGGHSGSLAGELTAGGYQPGPTMIQGSWSGCEVLYTS